MSSRPKLAGPGIMVFWALCALPPTASAKALPDVPGVVYRGPRTAKRIALTFDACSTLHNRLDDRVFDELVSLHVPATLFLGGKWMADDPDAVERLKADPLLELGIHGYRHTHFTQQTSAAVAGDLARNIDQFEKQVGHTPTLMRAPYAEIDARVADLIHRHGMTPVQYSLASGDPDDTFTGRILVKWVLQEARPGSIVVMHINGNGRHTADALPQIVEQLRSRGFELVTVSELIGAAPPGVNPAPMAPPAAPGGGDAGR